MRVLGKGVYVDFQLEAGNKDDTLEGKKRGDVLGVIGENIIERWHAKGDQGVTKGLAKQITKSIIDVNEESIYIYS